MRTGGNYGVKRGSDLRPRERRSDKGRRRGWNRTPEYNSWVQMCSRCNNLNHPRYADWGGRGITVSERWQGWFGFDNFLADMGSRPPGTTLERLDNDGNYGPDNCCWATVAQQNRNKRSTKLTTEVILEIERLLDGGTSLKVIAEATGINRHSVGTVATTIQALRSEHP